LKTKTIHRTVKQTKWLAAMLKGENPTESARIAGYKDPEQAGWENKQKQELMKDIEDKRALTAKKVDITREKQLKDLESVKLLASSSNNPSAMVSAIREQNEMLGYHRELAPNLEGEAYTAREKALGRALLANYSPPRLAKEA